ENVLNTRQESGQDDNGLEDLPLVHEVGEPAAAWFLLELRPRTVALLGEQFLDAALQSGPQILTHEALKDEEALFIQPTFVTLRQAHHELLEGKARASGFGSPELLRRLK